MKATQFLLSIHVTNSARPFSLIMLIALLRSLRVLEEETENGSAYHIIPLSPPTNPIFTLEEQEVLNKIASKFRDMSGKEISLYMHEEQVYNDTVDGEVILFTKIGKLNDF